MGVEPERCIVVEDAESGVAAGKAAGMLTIAMGDAAEKACGDFNIQHFAQLEALLSR